MCIRVDEEAVHSDFRSDLIPDTGAEREPEASPPAGVRARFFHAELAEGSRTRVMPGRDSSHDAGLRPAMPEALQQRGSADHCSSVRLEESFGSIVCEHFDR